MDKEKKIILDEYLNHVSDCYAMVEEWLKEKSLCSIVFKIIILE